MPSETGRRALVDLVARRVSIAQVFEDPNVVLRLVESSGGAVRDLLRLVRASCDGATTRIGVSHVERSIRRLVREYDYLVRAEDLGELVRVAREHQIPADEMSGRLLYLLLVLEYRNDTRWFDLHPAVRATPRVRALLNG